MSQLAKAELIRRELAKEAKEEDYEENFVKEIVRVAARMGGWTIDYVLHMPILRYRAVTKVLKEEDEQAKDPPKKVDTVQTFG